MPIIPLTVQQALDRHQTLVGFDGLGKRFNKEDAHTVWHYTNVAGMSGIISTSSLWASDYRYMNDVSEVQFGLEIFEMVIAHPESTPSISNELRSEILYEIAYMRNDMAHLHIFTTSFCLRGNVLSQWRAYARHDGLAMGFSREYIQQQAARQGYVAGRVHYYFSETDSALPKDANFNFWIGKTVERLVSLIEREKEDIANNVDARNEDYLDPTFVVEARRRDIVRKWIAETVAFVKHPAFEEEKEWRIVKVHEGSIFHEKNDILHRTSGSTVIPYVKFDLDIVAGRERSIRMIVLGPNADRRATQASVNFLISKNGLMNLSVASPFHPLRP